MNSAAKNPGAVAQTLAKTEAPPAPSFSNKPPILIIDKVSITIAVEDIDHRGAILECIYDELKKCEHPFETHGWVSARGAGYKTAMRIHAPNAPGDISGKWSKEVFALLQCDPRNGHGGFLRLEWNPARWGDDAAHLFDKLKYIMCYPDDYTAFLVTAKVTRIDVAIDIEGIRPDDYAWHLFKAVYRAQILKNAGLQTLYLGSKDATNGKGQVRVYDKAAQLKEAELKLTRIERTAKSSVRRVGDLPTLSNLFTGIECYDVHHALANSNLVPPEFWRFVHDSCAFRGLAGAMEGFNSDTLREKVQTAIKSSIPKFWNPKLAWTGWSAALSKAFPWLE